MKAHLSLPDISLLGKRFKASPLEGNKQQRVHGFLRAHIKRHRSHAHRDFYSMRELAQSFEVSLHTIQIVFKTLQDEGLLLAVSASKTLITGRSQKTRVQVQGVVGLPLWLLGSRYFGQYKVFSRTLGDLLWDHRIVVDTIPFWETEDRDPSFVDRLMRHEIDYLVWFQPFRHNRETILKFKDHGIRSLLISDAELSPLPPDIQVIWEPAYHKLLHYWKQDRNIRTLLIVIRSEEPRQRSHFFAQIARAADFDCEFVTMSPNLPQLLEGRLHDAPPHGIVLLDEETTVGMVFSYPDAFVELCRRHRFFFGRGMLNLPFVIPPGLSIERAFAHTESIAEECFRIISKWRSGDVLSGPVRSEARFISEHLLTTNP